ncbi:uncharacterized protein UV8b_06279 [Ustilaginoidea virens]|uniref:Sin3-associated polypeptide Sap18 n=1 Tax=Ustilaginoidea virens TaxID=1159556 RepID=A0A8E5MIX9_USTVR|nr:uncharacterized protein UV8b_06279 [Ustilaginoidea virens]QUC22038.1 hypothetical protein UV8b_06279 [Ustilaginoidea virens]
MSDSGDHDLPAPFLVQLFYRTGSFYRPEDFASHPLPPHVYVYTWPSCTLSDLALELAAATPTSFPHPAIGARLSFQLVCPDLRSVSAVSNAPPRYAVKDLGSVVIGQHAHGAATNESLELGGSTRSGPGSGKKTLNDARFVVGDYISCAILPPLADGSVAPASAARRESNLGYRDGRGRRGGSGGFFSHENGFSWSSSRESRGGMRGSGTHASVPLGEWRRGERVPYAASSRHRGGGVGGGAGDGRWQV